MTSGSMNLPDLSIGILHFALSSVVETPGVAPGSMNSADKA